jgi:hypothetical protein
MGTVADFYPSNYLSAADLKGAERIVTIDRVETNTFENDGIKKTKPVIHFKDNGIKPIVCNKTNFLMIAAICGDDSKDWSGKQICLFSDLVSFKGKVSEAIRAKRPPMAPQAAPAPAPTPAPAPAPQRELVVEQRANYDVATTKPVVAAAAARGSMDDEIPF